MKKTTVFVIPFILPWDWSADYQRQTCLELAKNHPVVAYMQKDAVFWLKALFEKKRYRYTVNRNVSFYRPLYVLPFRRFKLIEKINQLLAYIVFELFFLMDKRIILWIFDPAFYQLPRITHGMSIYDCVDYAWSREKQDSMRVRSMEKKLIRNVTYFFVNSHTLARRHGTTRSVTAIVPQGFRLDHFRFPTAAKIKFSIRKPIIGYIGALNHRIDYDLLSAVVKRNPQWQFVLWGLIQEFVSDDTDKVLTRVDKLKQLPNITFGKSTNRREVPSIIRRFDVAMIPYDKSFDANRYCYPMKLFEYFYMGKPVISTPIEELKRFPKFVKIGATVQEWEGHIRALWSKPWPESYKRTQRRLAIANSWEKKIKVILNKIQKT